MRYQDKVIVTVDGVKLTVHHLLPCQKTVELHSIYYINYVCEHNLL